MLKIFIKIFKKKYTGNVEPSSKRPRNNSNGSSNSTITTSSVNNQITIVNQTISNDTSNISVTTETESSSTFEWSSYIDKYKSEAAPVSFFKHAPLSRIWSKFNNLMVEVPVKNLPQELLAAYFECNKQECFWFAKVVQTAGYLVKLRYFGASSEASENEFWMHMCDDSLHPVGWTSENDFNLVPPESIVEQCEDWRDFCLKELVGYKTLPNNFKQKVSSFTLIKHVTLLFFSKTIEGIIAFLFRIVFVFPDFENCSKACKSNLGQEFFTKDFITKLPALILGFPKKFKI